MGRLVLLSQAHAVKTSREISTETREFFRVKTLFNRKHGMFGCLHIKKLQRTRGFSREKSGMFSRKTGDFLEKSQGCSPAPGKPGIF